MSSRTGSYSQAAGLRVRPVPELETCIVFTSLRPKLHMLNLSAWLVFELCDGRAEERIAEAYAQAAGRETDLAAAKRETANALRRLVEDGLVERTMA